MARLIIAESMPLMRSAVGRHVVAAGHDIVSFPTQWSELRAELTQRNLSNILLLDPLCLRHKDEQEFVGVCQSAEDRSRVILHLCGPDPKAFASLGRLKIQNLVLKTSNPQRLLEGIAAVAAGEMYTDPGLTDQEEPLSFTRRERELARLIKEGYSNEEIGSALGLRKSTVKVYVSKLSSKLGVRWRRELVAEIEQVISSEA